MIDGVGMFVSSIGAQLDAAVVREGFVGVIQSATQPTGGSPRVTVRVGGGDETPLTWVSSSVQTQLLAGDLVGMEIQIVSNHGQWAGLEVLIPCGKA